MDDLISRQAAIDIIEDFPHGDVWNVESMEEMVYRIKQLPSAQPTFDARDTQYNLPIGTDCISRQAAIDLLKQMRKDGDMIPWEGKDVFARIRKLPPAQPERVWHPVEKPPAHHKDVIVRGVEAIGNVTVHKVMQWDVDTWRPTNYAPSIMWTEWSEI